MTLVKIPATALTPTGKHSAVLILTPYQILRSIGIGIANVGLCLSISDI